MPATLTIRDETLGGTTPLHEWVLEVLTERVSVRELIRSRVYQEVQDYNRRQTAEFRGLIEPEGAERTLNGWKLKQPRTLDWQRQFEKAVEAFGANRVLILVNDRQAEALDDEFEVRPDTVVTFLRLTPLVGG
jgi:hypothetical protein